jgi:hypothetical protein
MVRSWTWRLATVFVAIAAGASCFEPGALATSPTPSALLSATIAAGRAEPSLHWVSTTSVSDGSKVTVVTDVATTSGSQTISIGLSGITSHATELFVGNVAYLKGDAISLTSLLGFTSTAASKEANRWIAISRSASQFTSISLGLTVSSLMSELEMSHAPTKLANQTVLGQKVVVLKGNTKATPSNPSVPVVLYSKSSGRPLPVELRETLASTSAVTIFSKWGEKLSVKAPTGAVPISAAWTLAG